MKIKLKKAYQIEWQDAYNGWHNWDEMASIKEELAEDKKICTVLSIGWCIYTDRKKVALVSNVYEAGEKGCDVMVIPRNMILEVVEIAQRT